MKKIKEERPVGDKVRHDQLIAMGLTFNGESYMGKGICKDFNIHWTEILADDEDKWQKKIGKMETEKKNREEAFWKMFPKPVTLNDEQLRVLKGMGKYWTEIAERPNGVNIARENEINQMLTVISPLDALFIILHYANTY